MKQLRRLLHVVAVCTVSVLAGKSAASDITVFAAASLKEALDHIARDYERETGITVTLSYAGSSALARQISYGAPADVFISANGEWMDWLAEQGSLKASSRVTLLRNTLVLIAHETSPSLVSLHEIESTVATLSQDKVALALVDAVPAGIYAKTALQHLGLWDSLEPHIVQTDNVRAALALVALQAARFGVVYATDAQADPRVRVKAAFPSESHPEILYPVALTKNAREPQAQAFLDYLQSDRADDVFTAYGFILPEQ